MMNESQNKEFKLNTNNIGKDITIILIAHRLNTVKNCDIIFKLKNGKVIEQGNFDKLVDNDKVIYEAKNW